ITNSSGNIIQHYVYSSFGKILKIMNGSVDNTANPLIKTNFAYTNREYDSESGLYYYRARYYAPDLGRFLTEDPHPGFIDFAVTVNNKFTYVANNPLTFTDPSGEVIGIDDVLIAMFISAAINAVIASAQHKGNFFENLMSWDIAGKAAFKAAIGTGLVIGGGVAGSFLAGGSGAIIGGALGGIVGTWATNSALGETASSNDYLFAGLFGALGGGFVHIQRLGAFATQGSRVGFGISDLNKGTVEGLINNSKPSSIKPVKVPGPM
ncbi:MAG: RHS repeat domain-containing protein, partial [Bacteriovoracaceae bacterium]